MRYVQRLLEFVITTSIAAVLLCVAGVRPAGAQILSGAVSMDHYGGSVAWAGDVNQDGFDDFLIGIPAASVGQGRPGQVQLFLGRFGVYPSTPDRIYNGELGGDRFGWSVSAAGDVNNDGFDDFLVGAPENDDAGADAGKVYLYLGDDPPPTTPARSWTGSLPGARMGAALAGGFDFNNDNRSDFATGAPDHNGSGIKSGEVKLFLGATSVGSITNPFTFLGDQANWELGASLDPAGDVDNDGRDDVIAGAPQTGDQNSGRAVIWFGQTSTSTTPGRLLLSGEVGSDLFGTDVSGAGDVNGDGYDDVLVGAPGHDSAGLDKGAIYLFRGGSTPNAVFDWSALGVVGGDGLGSAVDGGFDYSGDGVPDILAGAPGGNQPSSDAGEVRLYYGAATPSTTASLVFAPDPPIPGFEASDAFGTRVRFIGSYNGDAHAEFTAAAPTGNAAAGSEAGYVNVLADPDHFTPVRLLSLTAQGVTQGVAVAWRLADAEEIAGLRVDAEVQGSWTALHSGWLRPGTERFVDTRVPLGPVRYRLLARDRAGLETVLGETSFTPGVLPLLGAPDQNPFQDEVRLALGATGLPVSVTIWDVTGRAVRRLGADSREGAEVRWDGRDDAGRPVPPGVYFIRAASGSESASRKLVRVF